MLQNHILEVVNTQGEENNSFSTAYSPYLLLLSAAKNLAALLKGPETATLPYMKQYAPSKKSVSAKGLPRYY